MSKKYLKTTYDLGREKIIIKTYSAAMYDNHNSRKVRNGQTSDSCEKHNRKLSAFRLLLLLKANFFAGDWNIVLTYQRGLRPSTEESKKAVAGFMRQLRKWCGQNHRELKYIWTTHIGERGGIHHHVILPKCIPYDVLANAWKFGFVRVGHPLYAGRDYEGLALYLLNDEKNGDCPSAHAKGERRYNASKNLIRPQPQREWVDAGKWRANPKPPKGWRIVGEVTNDKDIFGYPYQKYTIMLC